MAENPAALLITPDGDAIGFKEDPEDGTKRLAIDGKVVVTLPLVPEGSTPVAVIADNPLDIGTMESPHDTEHVIPDGVTFTLQRVTVGGEGDASGAGSRVDIVYVDASEVEHLVARAYLTSFTYSVEGTLAVARNGEPMVGAAANTKIIVRRIRLSGGSLELDALIRGYETAI